jgi:hypothetical protein
MRHVIVIGPLVIGALPTLAILEIAFNEAWGFASGGAFDQKATREVERDPNEPDDGRGESE